MAERQRKSKLRPASRASKRKLRRISKKRDKEFDFEVHSVKMRILQEIKATKEVTSFKLRVLDELLHLPPKEMASLNTTDGTIFESYYSSKFKLPALRLNLSLVREDMLDSSRSISKPINIDLNGDSQEFARCIKTVHDPNKNLSCSRCHQNRLIRALDCGKSFLLCFECVKSSEEGRNSRVLKISEKCRLRNRADVKARRQRARKNKIN